MENEKVKESKERVKVIVNVLKQTLLLQKLLNKTVDDELVRNLVASLEALKNISDKAEFNNKIDQAIGLLNRKDLEGAIRGLMEAIVQ
ncbi:hypothetical protein [Sulfolobus sp. E11-6]|uniref:hypothetical protein n=1 Tax=Sulfolobus sp. E11-6 TaxID=2663020 RepID=UPI001296E139|nr:hypothetical protein [Sulfolobus sp. E11-6]QGA68929.1 hypothetical protein GFS33_09565 [Sulfolobus sp. E11-6]